MRLRTRAIRPGPLIRTNTNIRRRIQSKRKITLRKLNAPPCPRVKKQTRPRANLPTRRPAIPRRPHIRRNALTLSRRLIQTRRRRASNAPPPIPRRRGKPNLAITHKPPLQIPANRIPSANPRVNHTLIHIHKNHPHANLLPEPRNRRANRPRRPRTTPAPNRKLPTRIRLRKKPNRPPMQNRIPKRQNPSLLSLRAQTPSTTRRKIYRRPRQNRKHRQRRIHPRNRILRHRHPAIPTLPVQIRIRKINIAAPQPPRLPARNIITRSRNRPPYHRRPRSRPVTRRKTRASLRQPRRNRPIRRRTLPTNRKPPPKNRTHCSCRSQAPLGNASRQAPLGKPPLIPTSFIFKN